MRAINSYQKGALPQQCISKEWIAAGFKVLACNDGRTLAFNLVEGECKEISGELVIVSAHTGFCGVLWPENA